MPFPYFENISTDFTGKWSSPRNRKAPEQEREPGRGPQIGPTQRKLPSIACPHSMTVVRSSRKLTMSKQQCPICLEDYFSAPTGRGQVLPVRMTCSHVFCRDCIETHLSCKPSCPLLWCTATTPLRPGTCALCAAWQKEHAPKESLVLTVRATEMTNSIKHALAQLSLENDFYALPKNTLSILVNHIRETLRRYEWQFHSAIDLAELLDPFLLAVDLVAAQGLYGPRLFAPAPLPTPFPPREHDPDDYPRNEEPWIAGFFRQWALEYERENGEARDGWGDWTRKKGEQDDTWEWPYKRILTHKNSDNGVEYLVKWVGKRYFPSWVMGKDLDSVTREQYGEANGLMVKKTK